MNTPEERRLLEVLQEAEFCCYPCGRRYGAVFEGPATMHQGRCDVCGRDGCLTSVRHYGRLARGVADLTALGKLPQLRRLE